MRRVARCEVLNEQFILLATQISKEGDWQSVDGKARRKAQKGKKIERVADLFLHQCSAPEGMCSVRRLMFHVYGKMVSSVGWRL